MPKQSHFKDEIASSGFRPPRNDKLPRIATQRIAQGQRKKRGILKGSASPRDDKLKEKEKTLHFVQNDDAGLSPFSLSIVISTF